MSGEFYFQGETDFQSDVYDETPEQLDCIPPDKKELLSTEVCNRKTNGVSVETLLSILIAIVTGTLSGVIFEMLLREDPKSSMCASFVLHIWILIIYSPNALLYIFHGKIPLQYNILIVFFSVIFLYFKSYAIQYLPMPIFIVCSNLQLVAGTLIGKYVFHKSFNRSQLSSVVLVTLGCVVITVFSSTKSTLSNSSKDNISYNTYDIIHGFISMFLTVFSISALVPTSSAITQKYNADIEEQIFMQHFLALPLFAIQWYKVQPSLYNLLNLTSSDISIDNNDKMLYYDIYGIKLPVIMTLLVMTTFFGQWNRSVLCYISLELGPLTTQLLTTINKTIALLISMLYFNSPPFPSIYVWSGIVIQTIGSIMYARASCTNTPQSEDGKRSSFVPNTSRLRFSQVHSSGNLLSLSNNEFLKLKQISSNQRAKHLTCSASMNDLGTILEQSSTSEVNYSPSKMRRQAFVEKDSISTFTKDKIQ
jgi:drug/metabolite transporter (DMT)-like permease